MPVAPRLAQLLTRRTSAPLPKKSGSFNHFTRGRYALAEACRLSGVGDSGAFLVPAYHCITMLDPALSLKADIGFYGLNADLSPNMASLDTAVKQCRQPVRALLAAHFFGLIHDFSPLRQWCDRHGIVLIEDCSHVLFTENRQAAGAGIVGDYVVSSPYKFFPSEDGGLLYAARQHAEISPLKAPSAWHELRSLKHAFEKSRAHDDDDAYAVEGIDTKLRRILAHPLQAGHESTLELDQPTALFARHEAHQAALRSSRFIARHSPIEEISRARRSNYARWTNAVAGLPDCRPLTGTLPEDCIPYMFALWIDRPDFHFYLLKHLGFPVWRWDEMACSDYPAEQDYRLHLLHLPVHQSLSEVQMDWLTSALQKVLRTPPGERR